MKLSTRDLIITALFTALTAVGGFISIPLGPVPITLQSFFVLLSGLILGAKLGALSQITYVILGLIGLPVFSGGTGGLTSVVSPTFGFLISFIVVAYVIGKITEKNKSLSTIICSVILGSSVMYLMGIPYFYFIFTNYLGKNINFYAALKYACIPFIPGDIIKAIIAIIIAKQLISRLSKHSNSN
ncbi:biotin transporter BioY [Clostridium sp. CF011]|uniref:biotin transporter BioY n=1 Tax=Clostridium sp. CF011 TaxID=2843318 RepID=UPI001C0C636B|nr:biotin transporter BioY [Clostridium sp. CF011]MBU3092711.1 biotin transporter BioY [Clostridium sp. CF011]WAG70543.1 biotin transporter BioY [Clostridium sp. CF011]